MFLSLPKLIIYSSPFSQKRPDNIENKVSQLNIVGLPHVPHRVRVQVHGKLQQTKLKLNFVTQILILIFLPETKMKKNWATGVELGRIS